MIAEFKKGWRVFRAAPPGKRFVRLFESRKAAGGTSRLLTTMLGVLLLGAGGFLLFVPGPGLLLIAFGAALVAQQSRGLAKALDRLEPPQRKLTRKARDFWKQTSGAARAATVALVSISAGGAALVTYLWLFAE
jgi:hypothetical protein